MSQRFDDIDAQIERILLVSGKRDQTALADFLGIDKAAIGTARQQDSIPSQWLLVLLQAKNANPEWILTGNGPPYLSLDAAEHDRYPTEQEVIESGDAILRSLSSRAIADELVRRIAVATHRPGTR